MSDHNSGPSFPDSTPSFPDSTPSYHTMGPTHHELMHNLHVHSQLSQGAKPYTGPTWVLHLIATLMTGGLWLPVWIYFALFHKKKN